ncbi:MAG: DegT/DnrJ/EryC1/StrS family aminotransferase [Tepidiformaceae bacterium]
MTVPVRVPFVDMGRLHGPLRQELLAAFARVLDSGGYVQGAEVEAFEAEFGRQYGTSAASTGSAPAGFAGNAPSSALAVNSGTAALHLVLEAFGVGAGDTVITVANTFIATAEAITLAGATPVFADIEEDGFNIDPADAERRITPRSRAILAVHLYGQVADMGQLAEVCHRNNLLLIEDACQAHGAVLDGRPAGTIGDAGCLSFYPTKNVGTIGEGGMVLTVDRRAAARVRSLRDHGQGHRHEHLVPGYNYRMPELQAAALRVLAPHLEAWNEARARAAQWYEEGLAGLPVVPPAAPGGAEHVYHLYVIRAPERDALQAELRAQGIQTAIHYPTPIHLQPAYLEFGGGPGSLPNTEAAVAEILSLPFHPNIRRDEVDAVCEAILRFYRDR